MTPQKYMRMLVKKLGDHDCPGLAAEMSFHLLLSFMPAFVFIITLLGWVGSNPQALLDILEFANRILPPSALKLVREILASVIAGGSGGMAIVSFLVALWAGSSGGVAVLKGLNRVYGFSGKGKKFFLNQQLTALLLVMLMGVMLFVASNAVVLGNVLLTQLDRFSYLKGYQLGIISAVRWVVTVLLMSGFTAYIYATVPGPTNVHFSFRQVLPGAFCFVGLWLLISLLFSWYVENINQFNQVYDPLTGIIVLMIWVYMSCMAFLVGAEVSALCVAEDCTGEET